MTPAALAILRAATRDARSLAITFPDRLADHIAATLDAEGWTVVPDHDQDTLDVSPSPNITTR